MDTGMGVIEEIIDHRLEQADVQRILATLKTDDREVFAEKLSDILRNTSTLLEVSRRVSDSLCLDTLLPQIAELVAECLVCDRAAIFLHDSQRRSLYSRVAREGHQGEIRFPDHLGLAGMVLQTGEPIVIQDASADPRFNPEVDKATGYTTKNLLCAAIVNHQGQPMGVAQLINKSGDFGARDIALLRAIMLQASVALGHAHVHERMIQEQQAEAQILEVTTAISSELNLDALLQKIMEAVTAILSADRSTLFMHDAKTNELWSHVAQGLGMSEIRFPAHLGIAGTVFTRGETINIPDAYADSRFNQDVDKKTGYKTDTILCMPVINRSGSTIGVIQVLNKRGGPFSEVDEKRLKAFSSQASIAIENAKLFEDIVVMKNYNESILQSMSNGVIAVDSSLTISKINQAALRIMDMAGQEEAIIGRDACDIFFGKNAWIAERLRSVESLRKQHVAMDADLWLHGDAAEDVAAGKSASINLQMVPHAGSAGEDSMGSLVVLEDITNEKRLRGTMARYMTKELADKLLEEGEASLGGKMQMASVLFTDIRDFTSISEKLGAQDTVKMLNDYFGIMVDQILEHGGILDKYIGDAIMAVFGAPFSTEDDADNAVKTAIGMLQALAQFNAERQRIGMMPIRMGLGINTDDVLSGNIGSLKRMDFTVIGDGVNLASRLEGANKAYGTQVLVSALTVRALRGEYRLRELDWIRVKGKTEPVGIYEILDHFDAEAFPHLDDVVNHFGQGLQHYRSRAWPLAIECFEQALRLHPKDQASSIYRDRCRLLEKTPPAADWDGVWVMQSK